MRAASIRIVAPIPGRGAVGVEVPNPTPEMVGFRDLLEHSDFKTARAALPDHVPHDMAARNSARAGLLVEAVTRRPELLLAATHEWLHQEQRRAFGIEQFAELNAQVIGISAQDVSSHEAFSGKHGFDFPLLADTDKAVAGLYGTLGPIGFARRSVFIIDGDGIVRYTHRAIAGLTFRPVKELVAELEKLTP